MMISLKGLRILGIRTTYDPNKRRGVGSQVISFKSYLSSLDEIRSSSPRAAAQLDALRKDEVEQLHAWLTDRSEQRNNASLRSTLPILERQLDLSLSALETESGKQGLTPELAARLYGKMRDLQQQLKKNGHARPKISDKQKGG